MTTIELVKSKIASLDRTVNTYSELEAGCPVIKKQRVNEKMCWLLQNPETLKFAIITEDQVNEINNLYNIAKTGKSIEEDPFLFNI